MIKYHTNTVETTQKLITIAQMTFNKYLFYILENKKPVAH